MATYAGRYNKPLQDRYGNGYRNALVAVETLAGAAVTLYADRDKTAYTPADGLEANEIKADSRGNLIFFADPGNYQIVVTPVGGSTQAPFPISVLPDPLEPDASEGALAAEEQAREDADTALTQSIADEATARANADTALDNAKVSKAANLSDLASASTSRDNLGLGDAATQDAMDLPVSTAQGAVNETLTDRLPTFLATNHGLVCDGTNDDTAALNALLATVYAAGGGHIHFPDVARIDEQIVFPNNGQTIPRQPPIRLSGDVADQPGQTQSGPWSWPSGGLDLRYAGRTDTGCSTTSGSPIVVDPSAVAEDLGHWILNALIPDRARILAVNPGVGYTLDRAAIATAASQTFRVVGAKIVTLGLGTLELDHLALVDEGTSSAPFGLTTNTTVKMHDCLIRGNPSKSGVTCDQDPWVFGGPGDGAVLTSPLTSGVSYTSLPISPMPFAGASGHAYQIGAGANTQSVTLSGAVAAGATSLPVTSFVANADYPAWTPVTTGRLGLTGSTLSPFQGYGSDIRTNHFERVRRILGEAYLSDLYIHENVWWQTCGSNLSKAPSTLTSALTSGVSYTALPVTALSQTVRAGDSVQIAVATGEGTAYQIVTASAEAAQGATSIPVTSFAANANYAIGTKVFDTSRGLSAAIELWGSVSDVCAANISTNRIQMVGGYSYGVLFGRTNNSSNITFNNLQDVHANNIACYRFSSNSGHNIVIPGINPPAATVPMIDDMTAASGGFGDQTVIDFRQNRSTRFTQGLVTRGPIVTNGLTLPIGPKIRDNLGNEWFMRVVDVAAERIQFRRIPAGGAEEVQLELSRAHLVASGLAPTVAAVVAQAGTGAIATIAGFDMSHAVTLTSGSAALAAGEMFVVTFNKSYLALPRVAVTPANAAAAGLGVPYVSAQTGGTLRIGVPIAPTPSTVYIWHVVIIG